MEYVELKENSERLKMIQETVHNPDRYMVDLRQILTQGKKRIGLLVGAGAPVSIKVDTDGRLKEDGNPIIPGVTKLTQIVLEGLDGNDATVISNLLPELGDDPNVETILTRIRKLSQAIGNSEVHGINGKGYEGLADRICDHIGKIVAPSLPEEANPYTELVSWIGGTHRDHPVEVFTPNYDLLIEEAFERAHLPYFDGFSGAHKPFFDPTSISGDSLPARWSRLWKIHGSLGWKISGDTLIRTGSRQATNLIYPDHLKYDQMARQPYAALFDRLREFITTPDSLLICTGFSFFDAHITALLDEALAANTHTAILAFQFGSLAEELNAVKLALHRPNMSVYAQDGAVIFGVQGKWQSGEPPSEEWARIRSTFWGNSSGQSEGSFFLGDFAKLARFFALSQASEFTPKSEDSTIKDEDSESVLKTKSFAEEQLEIKDV